VFGKKGGSLIRKRNRNTGEKIWGVRQKEEEKETNPARRIMGGKEGGSSRPEKNFEGVSAKKATSVTPGGEEEAGRGRGAFGPGGKGE